MTKQELASLVNSPLLARLPFPDVGVEDQQRVLLWLWSSELGLPPEPSLPSTGLSEARAAMEAMMTQTVGVWRPGALVPDGQGGWTQPVALAAEIPGWLIARRTAVGQGALGGRPVARSSWELYAPVGSDIRPTDALVIEGVRYEVGDDDDLRTDAVALHVNLRLVRAN